MTSSTTPPKFANWSQINLHLFWFLLVALSHILSFRTINSYSTEINKLCYPGEYKNILSGMGSYDKDADCSHGSSSGSGSGLSQEALHGFHYNLIAKPTTIEWNGPFGDYCPIACTAVFISVIIALITIVRSDSTQGNFAWAARIIWFICLIAIPLFVVVVPWRLKSPEVDDDGLVEEINWKNIDYAPSYSQPRILLTIFTAIVMLMLFFVMLQFFDKIMHCDKIINDMKQQQKPK